MKKTIKAAGVPVAALAALLAATTDGAVAVAAPGDDRVDGTASDNGAQRWHESVSGATRTASGYYTFAARQFAKPVNRISATVTADRPTGSTVEVDVRGLRPNGKWTEWVPVSADRPVVAPFATTTVQVRAVVTGGATVSEVALTADVAPAGTAAAAMPAAAPTWSVFATREGLVGRTTANGHVIRPNDRFVALPSRRALNPNDGVRDYKVRVCNPRNGVCVEEPVFDVGPWNIRDDYWNPPNVRENWQDLPRGKPEATAAFYQNYNGGRDDRGRQVANPAGIDLADGTWAALGMTNNDFVDVTYLWKES